MGGLRLRRRGCGCVADRCRWGGRGGCERGGDGALVEPRERVPGGVSGAADGFERRRHRVGGDSGPHRASHADGVRLPRDDAAGRFAGGRAALADEYGGLVHSAGDGTYVQLRVRGLGRAALRNGRRRSSSITTRVSCGRRYRVGRSRWLTTEVRSRGRERSSTRCC